MSSFLQILSQGFSLDGQLEFLIKLVLASIFGFAIGWNRKSKKAGIRTFTLITLGSTLFTIISMVGFPLNAAAADQARLVAQVVTGVGFIGAGVIAKIMADKPEYWITK